MSERTDVDELAERLLSEPDTDPDDDLRMLSRQLLRRREVIDRLTRDLAARCDGTLDMIHANRDAILTKHEEGLRRIKKLLDGTSTPGRDNAGDMAEAIWTALRVVEAVYNFHPMHGESWQGWPEGS